MTDEENITSALPNMPPSPQKRAYTEAEIDAMSPEELKKLMEEQAVAPTQTYTEAEVDAMSPEELKKLMDSEPGSARAPESSTPSWTSEAKDYFYNLGKDFLYRAAKGVYDLDRLGVGSLQNWTMNKLGEHMPKTKELVPYTEPEKIEEAIERLNPGESFNPQSLPGKFGKHVAEFAGDTAALPIGPAKALGKGIMSLGAVATALEEAGLGHHAAQLVSTMGHFIHDLSGTKVRPSTVGKEKAEETLRTMVAPEQRAKAIADIEEALPKIGIENYTPSTNQLIQNPNLGMLEQTQIGMPNIEGQPSILEHRAGQQEAIQDVLNQIIPRDKEAAAAQRLQAFAGAEAEQAAARRASELANHERAVSEAEKKLHGVQEEHFGEAYPSAHQAGKEMQESLQTQYQNLRNQRREATTPLFEKLKTPGEGRPTHIDPVHSREAYKKVYAESSPEMKSYLESHYGDFFERGFNETPGAIWDEASKSWRVSRSGHSVTPYDLTVGLDRKLSRDIYANMSDTGELTSRGAKLSELRKGVTQDLAHFPEAGEAISKYKEYSLPVETHKKQYGKYLTKTQAEKNALLYSEIPHELFGAGKKAESRAHQLVDTMGHDKKFMEGVHQYTDGFALQQIVNKNGVVDAVKLDKFKKNYPALFTVNPKLSSKLDDLAKANNFVETTVAAAEKAKVTAGNEAFKSVLNKEPQKVISSIVNGTDPQAKMTALRKQFEHNPEALEAIDTAFRNEIARNTESPSGFLKYLEKHRNLIQDQISPEQFDQLLEVAKHYEQLASAQKLSRVPHSITGPIAEHVEQARKKLSSKVPQNVTEHFMRYAQDGSLILIGSILGSPKGGVIGAAAKMLGTWYTDIVRTSYNKTILRGLQDPTYFKAILQDVSTPAGVKKAQALMRLYRANQIARAGLQPEKSKEE